MRRLQNLLRAHVRLRPLSCLSFCLSLVNGVRYFKRLQIGDRSFDCLASIPHPSSCSMVVELMPVTNGALSEEIVSATLNQHKQTQKQRVAAHTRVSEKVQIANV